MSVDITTSSRKVEEYLGRGLTSSAWREEALARVLEMQTLLDWLQGQPSQVPNRECLIAAVEAHLEGALQGIRAKSKFRHIMSGAPVERASAHLDAAELNLLRLAPRSYLSSNMPNLCMRATEDLDEDDPRLERIRAFEHEASERDLTEKERSAVVAAIQGANDRGRSEQMRMRSFRNVIIITTMMLAVLALLVAILGMLDPDALPLCYQPEHVVVCPTNQVKIDVSSTAEPDPKVLENAIDAASRGFDALLIEFVGLLGASLAATVALRRIRGTVGPYSLPVSLALLKVPSGALTAFLGLQLVRAQFIPGLSALDSSAQIVAWAIVLGYAQQIFTRVVDQQAENVFTGRGSVSGQGRAREMSRLSHRPLKPSVLGVVPQSEETS
jgi:hypothetical protein